MSLITEREWSTLPLQGNERKRGRLPGSGKDGIEQLASEGNTSTFVFVVDDCPDPPAIISPDS